MVSLMLLITCKKIPHNVKLRRCLCVSVCILLSRWSEVKQGLRLTSVQLHALLQAWKQYSDLSSSCSEKLQQEKDRLCDVSKTASQHNNNVETLATCVHRLQVSSVQSSGNLMYTIFHSPSDQSVLPSGVLNDMVLFRSWEREAYN